MDTSTEIETIPSSVALGSILSQQLISQKGVDTLKYGDIVLFYTDQAARGLLRTEGLRNTQCYVESMDNMKVPTNFRECLFKVQPRMKYVAFEELQSELAKPVHHISTRKRIDLKYKEDLWRREIRFNRQEEATRQGDIVKYGDVVQLLHCKSGKLITILPNTVAEIETSCLKVSLQEQGSRYCWFTLSPRYKVRQKGDAIEISDFILMHCQQQPRDMLHANEATEVNLSHSMTSCTFYMNF